MKSPCRPAAAMSDPANPTNFVILASIFVSAVAVQIAAKKFHPFLYWMTLPGPDRVAEALVATSRRR